MNDRMKIPASRWLAFALGASLFAHASSAQVPPAPRTQVQPPESQVQAQPVQVPPVPTSAPLAPRPMVTLSSEQAAKVSAERVQTQAKCWADLEALCPGIENRQDRIRCIRKNRQNLPPSCRQAQQVRRAPIRAACAADGERLCKDIPRGRRRLKCLLEHRPEVSPTCGQALDQRRGGPGPVRGPLAGGDQGG